MSNYLGRKSDFTPSTYTRYFQRTETEKSSNGHVYFQDNDEEISKNYQIKRDLIFKKLFPSRYADADNNTSEKEQINQNGINNKTAQSLGDFIPLSNNNPSNENKFHRRQSSPQSDVMLASSDEDNDDNLLIEERLPTSTHESIVGHVHPRPTIENIRTILIRELYQRTSDPHTEWLKCKMDIPKTYINPKYYADFQRRYRRDIKKNTMRKNKSISNNRNTSDNSYHVFDLTINDEITNKINNNTSDHDDIIETSPPILPNKSSTLPEFIILDSDEDDNLEQDTKSSYFIDRSSTSSTVISQPISVSNDDYQQEDSKYAQLPTRNTSSPSIIRPILSKHQRRKKNNPTNSTTSSPPPPPLVSAIDRIIDQMDKSDTLDNPQTIEQQNLLIKQIKKRKKKKKKKLSNPTIN